MERTRTIQWQNPLDGAHKAMQMSGMEYLEAMNRGEIALPPLVHTLDFKVVATNPGEVVFAFTPQEFHYNPIGSVHGGVISAILDSAMGCALHTLLPAGSGYTTVELKVNFIKGITIKTGEVRAIGKVISKGNRTALTEATLVDGNNTLLAHSTSTCLLLTHR